jgi:hypothetical protein
MKKTFCEVCSISCECQVVYFVVTLLYSKYEIRVDTLNSFNHVYVSVSCIADDHGTIHMSEVRYDFALCFLKYFTVLWKL